MIGGAAGQPGPAGVRGREIAPVHGFTSPVKVQVQGGDILEVSFNDQGSEFSDVKLTGPADFCFDGKIEI